MDPDILVIFEQKLHLFIIDPLLGFDTPQRKMYDLGEKSVHILLEEGMWGLVDSFRERRRVQRLARRVTREYAEIPSPRPWSGEEIAFPRRPDNPEVSIVIPVYNNLTFTFNCLRSIAEHTTGSYEIIVVDDASSDDTPRFCSLQNELIIVRNETNRGFVGSCNRGAEMAGGQFILFLNNDTQVTRGWLEPLIRTMQSDQVGAVGSKLVYPDGRLQEAGGIVFNDASGWNYGRGDDPDRPEYNFLREVDYCSGAALMVRTDLFRQLGGFDEWFAPGYYEDTDLCFRIRQEGYRVLYQPKSAVIHYEGMTAGREGAGGMKEYQQVNREKFFSRWSSVLAQSHKPPDSRNLFHARIRSESQNILIIDHYLPTFDRDSGSLRMYYLLEILSRLGYHVTFVGDNPSPLEPYCSLVQDLGVEVLYTPYVYSIEKYLKEQGKNFDVVFLSRAHIAWKYIYHIRRFCQSARILFDTVDLQFVREARRYEIEGGEKLLASVRKIKEMELRIARLSDTTLVVSPVEKEILLKENPSLHVEVLSNIHHIFPVSKGFSERRDLLFIGGFIHPPNVDAVVWFTDEIFPLVQREIPEVRIYVVGDDPPPSFRAFDSDAVKVTGYVQDVTGFFSDCRVFVAPLRYGAGIKGKINQSMSYGLPVVTTTIGAEGMGLIHGENALIADDPGDFADEVIRLYRDEALWNRISSGSQENVKQFFSYEAAVTAIKGILSSSDSGFIQGKADSGRREPKKERDLRIR